ncbi:MAG: hypothetical protein WDO69_02990 [Pseudomonadota bacterium]
MSTQATATEAQPQTKSTDAEAVRRVLSVREPAKTQDQKTPAAAPAKPPAR